MASSRRPLSCPACTSPIWWPRMRPAAIHEIDRGPVLVAERAPVGVVRVDEMREVEAQLPRVSGDGVFLSLVLELGSVWIPITERPRSA